VVVAVGRLEIGAHPIPEILGLADIDDLAPVILEQVNTRLLGKIFQFQIEL